MLIMHFIWLQKTSFYIRYSNVIYYILLHYRKINFIVTFYKYFNKQQEVVMDGSTESTTRKVIKLYILQR